MTEEWRAIPDLAHYEASSLGRIRSQSHTAEFLGRWGKVCRRHFAGHVLSLVPSGKDAAKYLVFEARGRNHRVNRCVCVAFHGPPPSPTHEAAHLDGNSLSNVATNLAWATPMENSSHRVDHGTIARGEKVGGSKLTDADVLSVFERYVGGESALSISASFGMRRTSLMSVLSRQTWQHVDIDPAIIGAAQNRRAALCRTPSRKTCNA